MNAIFEMEAKSIAAIKDVTKRVQVIIANEERRKLLNCETHFKFVSRQPRSKSSVEVVEEKNDSRG